MKEVIAPKKLTAADKREAVKMFNAGTTMYTQIAEELKLYYPALNRYMTEFKKKRGILSKRKVKANKSFTYQKEVKAPIARKVKSDVSEELNFLRNWYTKSIKENQTEMSH